MDKHINEIAYEVAKENFNDKVFSFDDLCSKIMKHIKTPTSDQSTLKGELYSEIIQDTNFLYVGKQFWRLREFVSQNELKKSLANSLYDFDKSLTEEDFEEFDDLSERYDEESGMYYDEDEEEAYQNVKNIVDENSEDEEGE